MFFDFNEPTKVPEHLHHSFDMLVIDPPFVAAHVDHPLRVFTHSTFDLVERAFEVPDCIQYLKR